MKSQAPFSAGFSLLELLIVITISLVLIGGGIAAFLNFTDRRTVISSVDELKTYFQRAESKAAGGDLDDCEQLGGYRVETFVVGTTTSVSLQAECSVGTPAAAQITTLTEGVIVTPNIDAFFQVLNAGVELPNAAASVDITVTNGTNIYLFTLYREGRISEGTWQ